MYKLCIQNVEPKKKNVWPIPSLLKCYFEPKKRMYFIDSTLGPVLQHK